MTSRQEEGDEKTDRSLHHEGSACGEKVGDGSDEKKFAERPRPVRRARQVFKEGK